MFCIRLVIKLSGLSNFSVSRIQDNIKKYTVKDTYLELERYKNASDTAGTRLQSLYDYVKNNIGNDKAAIFQTHTMILQDSQFTKNIENIIKNNQLNAEFAVYETALKIAELFKQIDDEYLKQRYCDIIDSANTIMDILNDKTMNYDTECSIIASKLILPSEIIKFQKNNFNGFVTNMGSCNCHSAILARSMKIPAVINIPEKLSKFDGMYAVIDGYQGKIIIEPDEKTLSSYGVVL